MTSKQPQIPQIPGMGGKKLDRPDGPQPNKPLGLPQAGDEVFQEDFTNVGSGGFAVASEGFHHAKVVNFEQSESKSGNPQYVWQFRITEGDSKGIELRFWTSLLPQARWKVVESLEAIGIKASGSIARFLKSDVIGRPCIIEVTHDDYEGRINHKIQRVHPPDWDSVNYAKAEDSPF